MKGAAVSNRKTARAGGHEQLAKAQRHRQPQRQVEKDEIIGGENGAFGVAIKLDEPEREPAHPRLQRGVLLALGQPRRQL